jgi:hypothetical protein
MYYICIEHHRLGWEGRWLHCCGIIWPLQQCQHFPGRPQCRWNVNGSYTTIVIRNGIRNRDGAELDERHREAKYASLYLTGQWLIEAANTTVIIVWNFQKWWYLQIICTNTLWRESTHVGTYTVRSWSKHDTLDCWPRLVYFMWVAAWWDYNLLTGAWLGRSMMY